MITFKFRLYPNKTQQATLWLHANKLNFIYNYFLNQRIENYKNKIKTTQYQQQAELVNLKLEDPIIAEIHSQVLQQVPLRLQKAYEKFFKNVKSKKDAPGFPKFRACQNFFGLTYPQSGYKIDFKKSIFSTRQYGEISFVESREIKGNIRQVKICCDHNRFSLHITTDYVLPKEDTKIAEVGIDIGVTNLVVGSDGSVIKNCGHAKYFSKQIEKLQSERDTQTKKGSRRYKRLSRVIGKLYDAKNRKIDDFQHKVTKRLARKYDTIYAEDLSVKSMLAGGWTVLNKSVQNAKFGQFLEFLGYKVNKLVLVNPRNTSKTCNNCGKIHEGLKLSDRNITCSCGNEYDRDLNAAKNIYCLGRAILNHQELSDDSKYIELTIQEALAFR